LRSLSRKIRKLYALPGSERRLLVAAWFTWCRVALELAFRSPRTILADQGSAGAVSLSDRVPSEEEELGSFILRSAELVELAGRYAPVADSCLRRSLVLRRLLSRRGIETVLHLGVARNGEDLDAHAWLEWAGRPVTGAVENRGYVPLLPNE